MLEPFSLRCKASSVDRARSGQHARPWRYTEVRTALAGCPRPGQGYHGRVATIYEVARRAGVSTATVSRVLSQPQVVSPATRRKVMNAVERLGETPNAAAKNLRTPKTRKTLVTRPS